MTNYHFQAKDASPITLLHSVYGEEVTLIDQGEEITHRIAMEFHLGESDYAVLQQSQQKVPDEYVLFRIVRDESGELELETIDDDDEWEAVAEVYDELTFEP